MNFKRALFILLTLLILAGIHLYLNAQNIILNYQSTDLKIRLGELNSRNRQLGSQASRKEDLSYIEKTAKEKLGMVYPQKVIYIGASDRDRPDSPAGPGLSGDRPASMEPGPGLN